VAATSSSSETKRLDVGDKAPAFRLKDAKGNWVSNKDFAGKKRVVLYFYPRDDTPGCTKEACSFRDTLPKIKAKDAVVLGVSPDGAEAHLKFIAKYKLNFPLLSDPEHKVATAYGAWGEKVLYGKRSIGMIRKTFVIGKDGKIEYANNKVKADGHGDVILSKL
jgi:peroxiredoxin Q/BCP